MPSHPNILLSDHALQRQFVQRLQAALREHECGVVAAGLFGSAVGSRRQTARDLDLFVAVEECTPRIVELLKRLIGTAIAPTWSVVFANGPIFHRPILRRTPVVHTILHDAHSCSGATGLFGNVLRRYKAAVNDFRLVIPRTEITAERLSNDPHGLLASASMLRHRTVLFNQWRLSEDKATLESRCDLVGDDATLELYKYVWGHARCHLRMWERKNSCQVADWHTLVRLEELFARDRERRCTRQLLTHLADALDEIAVSLTQ